MGGDGEQGAGAAHGDGPGGGRGVTCTMQGTVFLPSFNTHCPRPSRCPMPFKLIGTTSDQTFELRDDRALVVGRASGSDLPVIDATVSRRHARITADASGMEVTDLG